MPVVYSAANPTEAHLCRQFLENEGIDARVDGEILWQAHVMRRIRGASMSVGTVVSRLLLNLARRLRESIR